MKTFQFQEGEISKSVYFNDQVGYIIFNGKAQFYQPIGHRLYSPELVYHFKYPLNDREELYLLERPFNQHAPNCEDILRPSEEFFKKDVPKYKNSYIESGRKYVVTGQYVGRPVGFCLRNEPQMRNQKFPEDEPVFKMTFKGVPYYYSPAAHSLTAKDQDSHPRVYDFDDVHVRRDFMNSRYEAEYGVLYFGLSYGYQKFSSVKEDQGLFLRFFGILSAIYASQFERKLLNEFVAEPQ